MRHHSTNPAPARDAELIAGLGACRLVKNQDGHFEFSGGTPEEQEMAEAWAGMFLREDEAGRETQGSKG